MQTTLTLVKTPPVGQIKSPDHLVSKHTQMYTQSACGENKEWSCDQRVSVTPTPVSLWRKQGMVL